MSKQVKQMEMDALKETFRGVQDFVLLNVKGLSCQADNQLRTNLRKQQIRVRMVKNSLARRVFGELGIPIGQDSPCWAGSTWLAWGKDSVASLSQEFDALVRTPQYKDKVKPKGAIAEGEPIPFEEALRRPTRAQALGQIIAMILSPGAEIASQIIGPASQIASQVEKISEKKEPEGAAPEGAPPEGAPPEGGAAPAAEAPPA